MSQLPAIVVSCPNGACPAAGKLRHVRLRFASLGVVEMPRCLLCVACGYEMFTVKTWPSIEGGDAGEEGMAKISVVGGPSIAGQSGTGATVDLVGERGPEVELPPAADIEREHPGTGQPPTAVEVPAGGTEHDIVADPEAPSGTDVPSGTIAQVLDWVNEAGPDQAPTRAARALAVEQSTDRPRSTLVADLERIAGQ